MEKENNKKINCLDTKQCLGNLRRSYLVYIENPQLPTQWYYVMWTSRTKSKIFDYFYNTVNKYPVPN
jgi:hypothetical protein